MKLIRPSFKIWGQPASLEGIYKQIEKAGRVCYKSSPKYRWYSEDKKRWINEDSEEWKAIENPKKEYPIRGENISAKSFVDRMIASGHGAMLEHGTVYLAMPVETMIPIEANGWGKYTKTPYSKGYKICSIDGEQRVAVTTNYRVIVENNWLDDLQYLCEPTEYHAKRITVHFVCDRGVSHEYVRHRVFSFAQESTRYCNYSNKDKFGGEVTFIIPCWFNLGEGHYQYVHETGPLGHDFYWTPEVSCKDLENGANLFLETLAHSEVAYQELLNKWDNRVHDRRFRTGYRGNPWTPQQARTVLPNALKTELVMTGFVDDWWGEYLVIDKSTGLVDQRIHGKFYDELNNIDKDKYRIIEKGFFPLRCSSGAHPQAQELAIPLREEFIKRGYINE